MRNKVIGLIKNNKAIYSLYYYLINSILKILRIFCGNKTDTMLFVCYGGRRYGDNIGPIYEKLINDDRFIKWSFVWAFVAPDSFDLIDDNRTKKVKIDSLQFFICAIRARCWITNVSVQRGLNFKDKDTLYCNTWHGVPLKKIGRDVESNSTFKQKKSEQFDLLFAAGLYDANIYTSAFNATKSNIVITGYPRNDKMFIHPELLYKKVIANYNLNKEKEIILYVPTYRDYVKDENGCYDFEYGFDYERFLREFSDKYILMIRTHEAIEKRNCINERIIDASDYPDVEDLLTSADIIITDYSGIIFDYALLKKPIICYMYDYDMYMKNRGLYQDLKEFLPFNISYTQEELFKQIRNIDKEAESKKCDLFVKMCGIKCINSTDRVVDTIYSALEGDLH